MPASIAFVSCSATFEDLVTASSSPTVGLEHADAYNNVSRLAEGRARSRSRSRSSRSACGMGSAAPVGRSSPRSSARAISSAKKGLPRDISCRRLRVGRGRLAPSRACNIGPKSSTESGSKRTRAIRSSGNARESPNGRDAAASRLASRSPIGSFSRRRTANPSADAVEGSSHCTSSSAISTEPAAAASRSAVNRAAETARASEAPSSGSALSRATSSACRCGSGSA